MKYAVIILAMLLTTLATESTAQEATVDNFTVQVDGLGCPFCAYGLEKKFKEFKGIDGVNIEMETGVFTFTYPSHDGLTMEKVEKQVEAAGYTAVDVKVTRANGETQQLAKTTAVAEGAELTEETLTVSGNCGMCAARINKAAKSVSGVVEADWNKKTEVLTVKFEKGQTNLEAIALEVAISGHDNDLAKANEETYQDLPGCCQYDR